MFSYEELQKYNETDICIYKYIVSNIDQVPYMTIRELANEIPTSTSTILRFCGKNNFDGYTEFKDALKKEITRLRTRPPREDLQELSAFFARAASSAFEEKLLFAVDAVRKADLIIFIGMGSSGTLAKYGARYFSNLGHFAVGLEDALYPVEAFQMPRRSAGNTEARFGGWENTVVVAVSESGETDRLLEAVSQFKQKNCRILSITNSSLSTLARLSDWNFAYHLNPIRMNGGYNGTTQVPVIFIMEALAKRM